MSPGNGWLGFPTGRADERHVAALVDGDVGGDVVDLRGNCREFRRYGYNISTFSSAAVFRRDTCSPGTIRMGCQERVYICGKKYG